MSPRDEYSQRLSVQDALASRLGRIDERIGSLRLLLAALTVIIAAWGLHRHAFSPLWLAGPIGLFAYLVIYHARLRTRRARAERAGAFYRRGLARIEDRWSGGGSSGERFQDPHHVYAADLDLFGSGSLFELLCTARTRMGEETLASWLLNPAPLEQIRERHECIRDLRERAQLREDVAVLGEEIAAGVRPHALIEWAEAPSELQARWIAWSSWLLPGALISSAIVWGVSAVRAPLLVTVILEIIVLSLLTRRLGKVLDGSERAFEDLQHFAGLLARMEREPFASAELRQLIGKLASHRLPASRSIEQLSSIAELAGSRHNLAVRLFLAVPFMYSVQVALLAERWRRRHGEVARAWVAIAGELEALSCFATYSHEHPEDPFPEFVSGKACFAATALGHPLMAQAACVRNDVQLGGTARALLVSGSNMSGKSTLLRTVGINAVLAMAGAPVRAAKLRLTLLQVGASIRINDSLQEGSSRFYAEITRLRQLFDLAEGALALLFLLDELLQGTNSMDRRIGAEGVLRAFMERQAIGLISTHDLALTEIRGVDADAIRNMHFQDELRDGAIHFDFRLRDGVVTQSNGLALMRSIGLRV
ncbi:MAG TPA: hypothetical protein VMG11_14085 [Steroidobacteraceae bacterium]|nr:hypothetical protein [Steroidobacteraceae bacterium]